MTATITREFKSGERIHANNVTLPRAPWEAAPTPPAPAPTEPTFATKPREPVWLSGRIGARPALRRAEPAADRFEAFEAALIAHARQDAMRRIREALGYSYPRIGRFFGRDHTTVVHGVRASAARAGGIE